MSKFRLSSVLLAVFVTGVYTVVVVNADHAWKKYHWDLSTSDTIAAPLALGDNLELTWDLSLSRASGDWDSSVLQNVIVKGAGYDNCGPEFGRVEVCNDAYGTNGWLGIASIWATRGKSNHIVQAVVKLNDTYFVGDRDTTEWRDYVMCQEVGHTFGLGHQDEDFYNLNLGTCMDYTSDPGGAVGDNPPNLYPNYHDYEMLIEMYAHLNTNTTDDDDDGDGGGNGKGGKKPKNAGNAGAIDLNDPSQWGQAIRQDARGQNILFERNLANGQVLITHVLWAN